jgi:hypothetical protein
MKNTRILERKEELKQLAKQIREVKREFGYGQWSESERYRFLHIAYCMARGRSYEQIEQKTHEHNKICKYRWEKINEDIAYLKEGWNEDVCASA